MSNIGAYEARQSGFEWSISERELGLQEGQPLNIGWICTDRICGLGKGPKPALLWENHEGTARSFTFEDPARRKEPTRIPATKRERKTAQCPHRS